jgi:hypothetical protein
MFTIYLRAECNMLSASESPVITTKPMATGNVRTIAMMLLHILNKQATCL